MSMRQNGLASIECVKVGYFYPECGYYQIKSRNFALESTKNEKVIS